MSAIDVSVVIPTFRREHLLPEAIASVCSQEGVSVEVIVVDDSPEGSAEAAVRAMNEPRVHYMRRETPSGGRPGAVRNDGVARANAPLLHFLDDDDHLFPGCLRDLADSFARGDHAMAYGRVVPFGDDRAILDHEAQYFKDVAAFSKRLRGRRWYAAQLLFRKMPFLNCACMVRRDVFQQFGGYDPELPRLEDVDLFLRIGRARGFAFVDRDVIHYRVGAPSIMNELRRTKGEHDPDGQLAIYGRIHGKYRRRYGVVEYRALQVLARVADRLGV
jgi:glycosyltransferase involved in cell wall biosynthesis